MELKTLKSVLLTFFLFCNVSYGQLDTTKYPICDVTFEIGPYFLSGQELKATYKTNSLLSWSVGTRIGNGKWKVFPVFKYSRIKTRYNDTISENGTSGNSYRFLRQQISSGIAYPIRVKNNNFIEIQLLGTFNSVEESSNALTSNHFGMITSIGYLRRLAKYSNLFINLNYDLLKTTSGLNDFSGYYFQIGASINLFHEAEKNQ